MSLFWEARAIRGISKANMPVVFPNHQGLFLFLKTFFFSIIAYYRY